MLLPAVACCRRLLRAVERLWVKDPNPFVRVIFDLQDTPAAAQERVEKQRQVQVSNEKESDDAWICVRADLSLQDSDDRVQLPTLAH